MNLSIPNPLAGVLKIFSKKEKAVPVVDWEAKLDGCPKSLLLLALCGDEVEEEDMHLFTKLIEIAVDNEGYISSEIDSMITKEWNDMEDRASLWSAAAEEVDESDPFEEIMSENEDQSKIFSDFIRDQVDSEGDR